MQSLGNKLLARATLARYEHRCIGLCHTLHRSEYILQRLAPPHNATGVERSIFLCIVHCRLALCEFERRLNPLHKSHIVPRLCHKVERSGLHALYGKVNASPSRHEDDRYLRAEDLDLAQQHDALLAVGRQGVVHIHEDKMRLTCTHHLYGLGR